MIEWWLNLVWEVGLIAAGGAIVLAVEYLSEQRRRTRDR